MGRGFSWTIDGLAPTRNPPVRPLLFYRVFCFIFWVVGVDFCFCLHSCDPKFSAFDHFPCILECCFSFSLLSSVCGGGRRSVLIETIESEANLPSVTYCVAVVRRKTKPYLLTYFTYIHFLSYAFYTYSPFFITLPARDIKKQWY